MGSAHRAALTRAPLTLAAAPLPREVILYGLGVFELLVVEDQVIRRRAIWQGQVDCSLGDRSAVIERAAVLRRAPVSGANAGLPRLPLCKLGVVHHNHNDVAGCAAGRL